LAPSNFHLFGPPKSHLGGKSFANAKEGETKVQKWRRQEPKYFYVAGFASLAKQWDMCISVGGGYVEKQTFYFSGSNLTCFTFYVHLRRIY
jgi:hypothetical protein